MSKNKTVGSVIGEGIDNTFGTLGNIAKGVGKTIGAVDDVGAGVVGYTLDAGAGAVKGVGKGIGAVADGVGKVVGGAKDAIVDGVSNLKQRGTELKTGTIIKGDKADAKVESSFQQNKDTIKSNILDRGVDKSLQNAKDNAVEL